jgi:PTH1 family peptidyl-tRNA hydrolase
MVVNMKLIVGLGNPGSQYERTRHNVGFRVVDSLAQKWGWKWSERRGRAILASGTNGTEKVVLAKPLTYMNLSGEAVAELVHWYKLSPADILIIYDELDLPIGKIRMRSKGSSGGHNGLKDIIARLHSNEFPRLRIGIEHPKNSRQAGKDYVLSAASGDEGILLLTGEERAGEAVEMFIAQGVETTMNTVNTDPEEVARKAEKLAQKKREREAAAQKAAGDEEKEPVN